MVQHTAILLLGPTGSGKTPLGDHLAATGLWDRPCVHFDFGAHLRALAAANVAPDGLSAADVAVVAASLRTGALLEEEQFHIARHLLLAFAREHATGDTLIVLNGLPRHASQATHVDVHVSVAAVVGLDCTADVVFERIRANSGGDRARRSDDDVAAIRRRLRTFNERTLPLTAHYAARGARIIRVPIEVSTQPRDIVATLATVRPATG